MKRKLMIVDDEKGYVDLLAETLRDEQTEVVAFNDSQAALDYARNRRDFDVVVTDIAMPKVSGPELVQSFKKVNPFLQVIVITAYPSFETVTRAFEAGADDFLLKPFDLDVLVELVRDFFRRIDRWKTDLSERADLNPVP